ncbi:MAG: hypothetical protein HY676_04310 [Chloroflexi bacterium]|nr:hypothetical protein [Chloroflexota bacterium]
MLATPEAIRWASADKLPQGHIRPLYCLGRLYIGLVAGIVERMRAFLENSGIIGRKAFLKSFVKRIEVDDLEATVVYTLPLLPDNPLAASEVVRVLPFVHDGPSSGIRTPGLALRVLPSFSLAKLSVLAKQTKTPWPR